ncbi:MAG: hypothetical protein R3B69_02250 [Candidatus Paceibacterota bacterium]
MAYLLEASGLLRDVTTTEPLESGRVIRRLFDEVESLVVHDEKILLRDILALLLRQQQYGVPLSAPYINTRASAVTVARLLHKAKGLEYEHVFIPHATDADWGGRHVRSYFPCH